MPACKVCTKSVYPMDPQVNLDGTIFHKACAKCQDCNCQISLSNFTKNETKDTFTLLCKTHYFKRFRENGSYPGAEQFQKNVNRNETAAILAQKVITTAGTAKPAAVAPQLLGTVPTKSSLPTGTPVKSNDSSENPVTPSQWTNALKKTSITIPSNDSVDEKGKQSTPTQWTQAIKRTSISQTNSDDQNDKPSTPSSWTGALRRGSKTVETETAEKSPETNSTPQSWNSAIRRKSLETIEVTNNSEKLEVTSPPSSWNSAILRRSYTSNHDEPQSPKVEAEAPAAWSNVLKKSTDKEEEVPVPVVVSSIESEPVNISYCPEPITNYAVAVELPVVENKEEPVHSVVENKEEHQVDSNDNKVNDIPHSDVVKKSPLTIPIIEPVDVVVEDSRGSIDEFSDTESGLTPVYANDREELEDTNMDKIVKALSESKEGNDELEEEMSKVVNKIIDDDDDLAPVGIVQQTAENDDDDDLSPVAVSRGDREMSHNNNNNPAFI